MSAIKPAPPGRSAPGNARAAPVAPDQSGAAAAPENGCMRISRMHLASAIFAALVIAAFAWGGTRVVRGPTVPLYVVARGPLVQTVVASGRVESPRRVEIGSQVTGTVASIPVDEGQAVKSGQLLVALDESEARAAVDQSRYAVAQAE